MENNAQVIKHLEMIQGVINRLGYNSFSVKAWSMAILVAGIAFIAKTELQSQWIILTFLIPIFGFWILDAYFLWQERLFRKVYDDIRKQEKTDFAMNPIKHIEQPKCKWLDSVFSVTLNIFYGIESLFVLTVFVIFYRL